MKSIILYISLLLLLATEDLNAQCIQNHDFATYCGIVIYKNNNPTFADDCLPPWMPSHGTPQVIWQNFASPPLSQYYNPTNKPEWNTVYMWAGEDDVDRSEGILSNFLFKKNYTYKIQVKYRVQLQYPNNSSDANFNILAAVNIHRPSPNGWHYGNQVPSTDAQTVIGQVYDHNTGWTTTPIYTFTPTDRDYTQFWIYPYTTSHNQYNLWVDWISVCREECTSSYTYNQGTIPAGEPRFGYIYIGSSYSGGSGTVTVSSTATTVIEAAKEIIFKPNFAATVTSGSFTARINSTSCPNTVLNREDDLTDTSTAEMYLEDVSDSTGGTSYEDEYGEGESGRTSHAVVKPKDPANPNNPVKSTGTIDQTQLRIYPNPAQHKITLEFISKRDGDIKILLMNSVGIIVREVNSKALKGKKFIDINIENLAAGSYLLYFADPEGNVTVKKIQKLK